MALAREVTNAGDAIDSGEEGAEARSEKAVAALTTWESGSSTSNEHQDVVRQRGEARDLGLNLINRAGGDDSGEEKNFVDELMKED